MPSPTLIWRLNVRFRNGGHVCTRHRKLVFYLLALLLLAGLLLLGLFLLELFVGFAPLGALLLMLPGCALSTSLEHLEILVLVVGGVGPRGSHPVAFLFAAPWSHAVLLLLLAWSVVGAACKCGL